MSKNLTKKKLVLSILKIVKLRLHVCLSWAEVEAEHGHQHLDSYLITTQPGSLLGKLLEASKFHFVKCKYHLRQMLTLSKVNLSKQIQSIYLMLALLLKYLALPPRS